jgi:mRNA interferase RelE/StbE
VPYFLKIKKSALKELQRLDKPVRERLVAAIDELAENPHVGKLLKGDFSGLRRLRVGAFRIIYEINEGEVLVLILRVAQRKNAYRGAPPQ